MKRSFLMLAETWSPKVDVGGWYASEKLDGMRAFWDGGISRGMLSRDVPWGNVEKDKKLVYCTGLWSRHGKVIHAPKWWLESLPRGATLDLELWMGRGRFQETVSACRTEVPGGDWREVRAMVIDSPSWQTVLLPGIIDELNFKKAIHPGALDFVQERSNPMNLGQINYKYWVGWSWFEEFLIEGKKFENDVVTIHEQKKLPRHPDDASSDVEKELERVTNLGGEGLVLRASALRWLPQRSKSLLKVKKLLDAEGTVTGYTWGRKTNKGSKLLGKMGALILDYEGRRLELSGFEDSERVMLGPESNEFNELQGRDASDVWTNPSFPRGSRVTFKYRELSSDGVPKEARFHRLRKD